MRSGAAPRERSARAALELSRAWRGEPYTDPTPPLAREAPLLRGRELLAGLALVVLLAPAGTADWPQFRHDDAHTGHADTPGAIQADHRPWTFDANGAVISSPAVADVDGERTIVVGSYPGQSTAGTVYALAPDGQTRWSTTPVGSTGGYVASPTVEDLDGDGAKEVVVPSLDDSTLRVFDARTGEQAWSTQVGSSNSDLLASSPIVADLHGADGKEIALGGSTGDQAGSLLLYDGDGTQLQAIELDGPAWSTPLHADLDADGDDELYLATGVPDQIGQLFPSAKTGGKSLYAFERSGDAWSIDWQTPLSGPTLASPTAADLDEDGTPELVLGAQGGHFYAVDPATGAIEASHTESVGPLIALSSPLVGDVDHDGTPEAVVGVHDGLQALELTSTGFAPDGRISLPLVDGQDPWVGASPALADIDGDGTEEILASTVPVNVTDQVVNSDALPGTIFAVDGTTLTDAETQPAFAVPMPDDGGISGPTVADVDGDGRSEVLAGEGIPIVGNGSALHLVDAANPVVEAIEVDPAEPTTQDEIAFTADARDEDTPEDDLAYAWTLGDGTATQAPTPTHSYADDGSYTVEVTVEDPDGHAWTATRTVDVANVPPEASAAVDTTLGSLQAAFDATLEDPDGTVEALTWELGDGTTTSEPDPTHTYDTGGTYTATLTATDDDGATTTLERTVHVNRVPTLEGPATVDAAEAEAVQVDLTVDDPDGDPVHLVGLDGPDNATASRVDADTVRVTWTPGYDVASQDETPVPVTLHASVEDEGTPAGATTHALTANVTDTNRAPEVGLPETRTAHTGTTTTLTGTLADPDGDPLEANAYKLPSYASFEADEDRWTITVDPPLGADPYEYPVTVTAEDGLDLGRADFYLDIVPNQPPTVHVDGPDVVQPDTRWDPTTVFFQASAEDPEDDPIRAWTWTVDADTATGPTLRHAFDQHGIYEVHVAAEDAAGNVATAVQPVHVDDALTGDVTVHEDGTGPRDARTVQLSLARDDGTPLAEHPATVTVRHELLDRVSEEHTVHTDAHGTASLRLDGDVAGTFLPGQHRVLVHAEAGSLDHAPLDDLETVTMEQRFAVSATG